MALRSLNCVRHKQDVGWLEIRVHNACLVQPCKGCHKLAGQIKTSLGRDSTRLRQQLFHIRRVCKGKYLEEGWHPYCAFEGRDRSNPGHVPAAQAHAYLFLVALVGLVPANQTARGLVLLEKEELVLRADTVGDGVAAGVQVFFHHQTGNSVSRLQQAGHDASPCPSARTLSTGPG